MSVPNVEGALSERDGFDGAVVHEVQVRPVGG
jgi:hypothetical protein